MEEQPVMSDFTESEMASQMAALSGQFVLMQETMTHLQHDVEQMHDVMIAQQQELELLRREIVRLDGLLEGLDSTEDGPRTIEDDRPPHY